ncbi:MAG: lipopolysaccharide heptosyltransferase II [Acidobacteriota bacterium]
MKIFLRSPNWIGDCVMSLPAIRALKDSLPEIEIVLITKPHLSSIYKNIPGIADVVLIPSGKGILNFFKTVFLLKKYRIKKGILLTNSFNSALSLRLSGVKDLTGYVRDMRGWLLSGKGKFPGKSVHQIEFYMGLIKLYLNKNIDSSFSNGLVIHVNETETAENILRAQGCGKGDRKIGISPVAAYGTSKEWPVEKFIDLIREIEKNPGAKKVILFGSEKDEDRIKLISDAVLSPVIAITGKYSLREAISVISICDLFIGNDSGLLHVADGLNIPSIGLFGPTSPDTSAPLGDRTEIIYKNVDCSPCSYRECPLDHKCMSEISVAEIFNKTKKILEPS